MPETSSFVDELPPDVTEMSTPAYPYPLPSRKPYWPDNNPHHPGRPSFTTHPSFSDDNYHGSFPTSTTLATSHSQWYDQIDVGPSTALTTPTVPTDDALSPAPTDDGFPGLQSDGADNGPSHVPVYAAAAVTPVVVMIVGLFVFFYLRKRRRQRQGAAIHAHFQEMKMQSKPVVRTYIAPSSPPPAVLPQYSPASSHPPTASSSQPVILGPISSGTNGAYLTGMDTSDRVSMTSASNISRNGMIVDRDPFADGRSLEEAPPPYRPSSLPPASLASPSRTSSVRIVALPRMTSRTHLIERSPFDDPEDDEISEISGPTMERNTDAMSDVSDLSYQIDPVVGRSTV